MKRGCRSPALVLAFLTLTCSAAEEFFVDSESTVSDGSRASPFETLSEALTAALLFPQANVHLLSVTPQEFPSMSIDTSVNVIGTGSSVLFHGPVTIIGTVAISSISLEVQEGLETPLFKVEGTLLIRACRVEAVSVLLGAIEGEVFIDSSVFEGNQNGLFYVSKLGSYVEIANSRFIRNSGDSGTIIRLVPATGAALASTQILVTSSTFDSNDGENGSVLYASDTSEPDSLLEKVVQFSNCTFTNHSSAIFFLSLKSFELIVEDCDFINSTAIVKGRIDGSGLVFAFCSVSNSVGPLFSVSLAGVINVTHSVFERIKVCLVDVSGINTDVSKSVVALSKVEMSDFENKGELVLGAILNSVYSTILLTDVSLRNFGCPSIGALTVTSSVLLARNLYLANGFADSNVIGLFLTSTLDFQDFVVDYAGSRVAMSSFTWCALSFKNTSYRRIIGIFQPSINANTTTIMFIRTECEAVLDGIYTDMKVLGTVLFYVSERATVTMKNSVITGVVGRGFTAVQQGEFVIRNSTIDIVRAGSFMRLMQGGLFDIDYLRFSGTVFADQIFTISSGALERIGTLELINVTAVAISRGQSFSIDIGTLLATSVRCNALFDFSVNM